MRSAGWEELELELTSNGERREVDPGVSEAVAGIIHAAGRRAIFRNRVGLGGDVTDLKSSSGRS